MWVSHIKNFVQNTKGKFYLQKYHKLGYDIERMFEHTKLEKADEYVRFS